MDFGVFLPRWEEAATPVAWRRVAVTADRFDYDYVGMGDHIVFLEDDRSWGVELPTSDVFAVLSFVAGLTEAVRIGTNICVVPYRHPVQLAKLALTLDQLSAGRFEFGVGAGWCEPEFAALDVPANERGKRTDEFLALFEQVCAEPIVSFEGNTVAIEETAFRPRPVQEGGPPIMVGGHSSPAFRRTAQFGDGWLFTTTPAELADDRDRIMRAWANFDRSGEPYLAIGNGTGLVDEPTDEPLIGPADHIIRGIEAYESAGADRIDFKVSATAADIDGRVDQLERLATEVLPSFR